MNQLVVLTVFLASIIIIADLPMFAAGKQELGPKLLDELNELRKVDAITERTLTNVKLVCDKSRERELRRISRFTLYMEFKGIKRKFRSKEKALLRDIFVDVYNEVIGGCSDEPFQRLIQSVKITKQCLFDNIDDTRLLESFTDQDHRNLPRNRNRSYLRWDGTVSCGNACENEDDPLFEEALDGRMLMQRILKNRKRSLSGSGTCCDYNRCEPICHPCPLEDEFRIEFDRELKGLVQEGEIQEYNSIGDITSEKPDIDGCNFRDPVYTDCEENNPCTQENIDAGHFHHAHSNPSYFVQCTEDGQCFDRPCAPGTEFNQNLETCTTDGGTDIETTLAPQTTDELH